MNVEMNIAVNGSPAATTADVASAGFVMAAAGGQVMSNANQVEAVGRFTVVPAAWDGQRLYDWGKGGIRSQGNDWVRAPGRRPQKCFRFHQGAVELTRLAVGGDRKLLYRVRGIAGGEMWPVYERAGKYWARRYYIVPTMALRMAHEQLGGQAA